MLRCMMLTLVLLKHLDMLGIDNDSEIDIRWVNAEDLYDHNVHSSCFAACKVFSCQVDLVIAGLKVKYRQFVMRVRKKIPFFGICLGMQVAVIEYARSVCGLDGANSSEINPTTAYPVIDLLPEQKDIENLGGTMRLGLYPCKLAPGSLAATTYNDELVYERHRHRYEFNNEYRE